MSDHVKKTGEADVSAEQEARLRQIAADAVRSVAEGLASLAEQVRHFNENREVVRERIRRGARRTSGRIV